MNFESGLQNGKFLVGQCTKCQRTSWPPSDNCSNCFGALKYRPVMGPGILIEWSSQEGKTFGLVEFEGTIRVMGAISSDTDLMPGVKIRLASCSFDKTPKFAFSVQK